MVIDSALRSAFVLSSIIHLSFFLGGNQAGPSVKGWEVTGRGPDQTLEVTYSQPVKMAVLRSGALSVASEQMTALYPGKNVGGIPTGEKVSPAGQGSTPSSPVLPEGKDFSESEEEMIAGLQLTREEKPLYLSY